MKSFFLLFALIAAASVSAFAPNYSRKTIITSNIKMFMARGKPAKSQEEDLELTRAIIMKHIGSVEDYVVDDNDMPEEVEEESSEESEGESFREKLKDKGRKIREKGRKIKKKLKNAIENGSS